MNTFSTDYVYRLAEKRRRESMATYTPAGKFWVTYFAAMTFIVGSSLVYWLFLSATDATDIAYMVMIGLFLIGLCCLRVK